MHGFVDDRFARVGAVFEESLTTGAELGASVCVNIDGQTVAGLWGGYADAARTRPWQPDTIVNVYSCTKTMTALTALLLADRGAAGKRLMSEAGCRRALDVQVEGRDLILGLPLRFGLGFAVSSGMMPNPNTLYWGGLGGSLVIVDLDASTTFAYAPNRMADTLTDVRGLGLAMAMWESMALL